ncbi:MAG TPA: iron donor protein CyaY [Polyangiaceae bacterium]|nr:iron donor protein CyaY [Polyangiaceae bacterium]
MTSLGETEYEKLAYPELEALLRALDGLAAQEFEAELAHDILNIEFADGTKYVVNSHRAARQIWMAADRSAWHFDWNPDQKRWIAEKTGDELWATISRVLGSKLGEAVELERD